MSKRKRATLPGMFGTYERLHVHVHASNMQVIRAVREKLDPTLLTACHPAARERRKAIYVTMIKHHKEAAALFRRYRFR